MLTVMHQRAQCDQAPSHSVNTDRGWQASAQLPCMARSGGPVSRAAAPWAPRRQRTPTTYQTPLWPLSLSQPVRVRPLLEHC